MLDNFTFSIFFYTEFLIEKRKDAIMTVKVDLNSDLGESFGIYKIGNDNEVLKYVSSANIACGLHAGDPFVMHKTVRLALENNTAIGAHPGYMDLNGFGRRKMDLSPQEVYNLIVYQVGALAAFVKAEGGKMQHVKPHGALYNTAAKDEKLAAAIAKAVYDVNPELILYGLAGSWGSNIPDKSDTTWIETAGLGLFVDPVYQKSCREDDINYLFLLQTDSADRICYHVSICAGREEKGFKSSKEWFDYLKSWKTELTNPCHIRINKAG